MKHTHWIPVLLTAFACTTSCERKNQASDSGKEEQISTNIRTKSDPGTRDSTRATAPGNKLAKRTVEGEFEHSLDVAEKAESAEERNKQIAGLAWSTLESRPDLMELAMRRLPNDSPEKPGLIEAYLLRLVQTDPEEAIRWADSLGDPESVLAARQHIALSLPAEQTERAVELLLDSRRIAADGLDNASSRLLERWQTKAPVEAANWVANLPTSDSRSSAVKVIADQWIQTDMNGALIWLGSISDQEFRSEFLKVAARVLSEMPVELRDELSVGIQDPAALQTYEVMREMLPDDNLRDMKESTDMPAPDEPIDEVSPANAEDSQ